MYIYLFIDTMTNTSPGSLIPHAFTLQHWKFLWTKWPGRPNIWRVTLNTLFASASSRPSCSVISSMAGYALSRLNVPGRGALSRRRDGHARLSLDKRSSAIFIVLQMVGLYNTLIGVILVKAALDLPLGIWLMKGFYDTVPWEIEMAGITDGASRFTVWRRLVLPQVFPALARAGALRVSLRLERVHLAAGTGTW